MRRAAFILSLTALGCARVWGFEDPVLDAGPAPIVREPCFENEKIERVTCPAGDTRSRICTPEGWSSFSKCAKVGWRPMTSAPIKGRIWHSAVWTGDELIVWGGRGPDEAFNDGAAYDPIADRWRVIAPAPLSPRIDHAAVWTGKQMMIWGGRIDGSPSTTYFADGALYDPRTNTWDRIPGSPMSARARVGAVWSTTTREAIFFGGVYEFDFHAKDGASFDPVERRWTYASSTTATPRAAPSTFWDGTRMVVVGGECKGVDMKACHDVWAYEPAGGLWEKLSGFVTPYTPDQFFAFTVAGKTRMALFGGEQGTTKLGIGGVFDASTKTWKPIAAPTSELGPKPARVFATTFWAEGKLWVHGGSTGTTFDDHTATWDEASGTWAANDSQLGARMAASATSSHDDTFVWGGRREGTPPDFFAHQNDGRILRHAP